MASHRLIDGYLAELAARLPGAIVEELADGLTETWHHRMTNGLDPDGAARAAITEFGTADRVAGEFVTQAPGRRIARLLLATGPLMGLCWGTSLIVTKVWTWPIPTALGAVYGTALLVVVAALLAAGTSRRSYRRTRVGAVAAPALVLLDAAMICAVAGWAPAPAWPMTTAIVASLVRIGLVINLAPRIGPRIDGAGWGAMSRLRR